MADATLFYYSVIEGVMSQLSGRHDVKSSRTSFFADEAGAQNSTGWILVGTAIGLAVVAVLLYFVLKR